MNTVPNRKIICDTLIDAARNDRDIIVLCSDSRGSASMTPFFETFPYQSVEVGIAEQNLVSISAGLAKGGKKPFAFSPACFISTRSYEQVKVDVAYSNMNVKLIGISGGISYGALGMSHHSAQDIAAMASIPNMRVYLPSDRFQTSKLIKELLKDKNPAYVRVGRNPVRDVYSESICPFEINKSTVFGDGEDLLIVACGEMVKSAVDSLALLKKKGIHASVLDMYCIKPLDKKTLLNKAYKSRAVITIEEHSFFGGLGSIVSQIVSAHCPQKVVNLSLPDVPVIAGKSEDVFQYYKLNVNGIVEKALEIM